MSFNEKIPLKNALAMLIVITCMISGSASVFFAYFKYIQGQRIHDSKYEIQAIIQASNENEPLKTVYLAELLNLSINKPTNIYRFNTHLAEHQLLLSPLIKKAEVRKIYPGTIHVHYISRVPIAFLVDYANTAIDKDGVIIPIKPFFTPKILPEIYLGLESETIPHVLGYPIKTRQLSLAKALLKYLGNHICSDTCQLKRIDVSDAYASSYGQKQIVVVLEEKIEKLKNKKSLLSQHLRILRLTSNNYEQELQNYLVLQRYLAEKLKLKNSEKSQSSVIDLRIPQLAFIKVLG